MDANLNLDEYIDFQKYWLVLKRRWIPATATFVCIVAAAVVGSLSLPEIYEADAELLIKVDRTAKLTGIENGAGEIEGLTTESDPLATEVQIVESRPLVEKLITKLDLKNDEGEVLKYKDLVKDLNVKPITGTDLLHISYTDQDPELATLIVNQVIELYVEDHRLNNRSETTSAKDFIIGQLPQVEANVRTAEANLRSFKNQHLIANLEEETTAIITALSTVARQIEQIEASLGNTNARYNSLQEQLGMNWQEAAAVSSLSQSLAVQKALEQLQEVKVELAQKRNYLSDLAPQIVSLREQEADLTALLDRQIATTLGGEKRGLVKDVNILSLGALKQAQIADFSNLGLQKAGFEQELANLKNTYNSYQQRSNTLPKLQEQQRELERRVEAAQSTYQNLLGKLQETQLAEQQNIGNVRIISQAVIPEEAVGPRRTIIVAGAFVMGGLLGLAVAFWLDIRDRTIKNTQEIEEMLAYPLHGVVPNHKQIAPKQKLLLVDSNQDNYRPQLTATNTAVLPIREAYNNIQISLKLFDNEATNKVIVITSTVAGEGKSLVSANLAIAKALCGQKILLVDGDLRRPTQHSLWEIANDVGLSDVLKQQVKWQRAITKVMPNLDIITAGARLEHPVSLLDSESMESLITKVSEDYDLVIFDTPPLIGLADTKILSKSVDGLLLVVRPGVANYSSVTAAKKLLAATDFNVLGIVANGVDFEQELYDYGSYYSRAMN